MTTKGDKNLDFSIHESDFTGTQPQSFVFLLLRPFVLQRAELGSYNPDGIACDIPSANQLYVLFFWLAVLQVQVPCQLAF